MKLHNINYTSYNVRHVSINVNTCFNYKTQLYNVGIHDKGLAQIIKDGN